MRRIRSQTLVVLAFGASLGYLAANGAFSGFRDARAATANHIFTKVEAPLPAETGSPHISCCDISNAMSLAQAKGPNIELVAQRRAAASGKKPNIVFIMGDDVGWFNIGAY